MNTINEVINGDSNILNKEITSTIVKSKIKGVKNILPENQILIRNNHQLNDKIGIYILFFILIALLICYYC